MYDELAVKNLMPQMMLHPEFAAYMPDKLPLGRTMDRTYFWTVLNTLNEEYT